MVELLGMISGAIFRMVPELFKMFSDKKNADHEYRMSELQLKIDQARASQQLDLARAQGDVAIESANMAALTEALRGQSVKSGVRWIDGLSASVRPIITYWWCMVLYTVYKTMSMVMAVRYGVPLSDLAAIMVTEFDRTVIGSVISFWFVDRSIRRGKL